MTDTTQYTVTASLVDANDFLRALKTALVHVAKNDARFYLCGVRVALDTTQPNTDLTIYATDGHTAARVRLVCHVTEDEPREGIGPRLDAIISTEYAKALIKHPMLASAARQGERLRVTIADDFKRHGSQVIRKNMPTMRLALDACGTILMDYTHAQGQLVPGIFPDVDRVIAPKGKDQATEAAGFDPRLLDRAAKSFTHWSKPSDPMPVTVSGQGYDGPTLYTMHLDGLPHVTVAIMPMRRPKGSK